MSTILRRTAHPSTPTPVGGITRDTKYLITYLVPESGFRYSLVGTYIGHDAWGREQFDCAQDAPFLVTLPREWRITSAVVTNKPHMAPVRLERV